MTLVELRQQMRNYMFDFRNVAFSDDECRAYLNVAMQHVANLLIASDSEQLIALAVFTISQPADASHHFSVARLYDPLDPDSMLPYIRILDLRIDPPGYDRVRHILLAERSNVSALVDDDVTLKHTTFQAAVHERDTLASNNRHDKPAIFLYNQALGFVQPSDGIGIVVYFIPHVPDMVAATDTPGQANGVGGEDFIPATYQHLIPVYAALLALTSENAPEIGGIQAIWKEMGQASGLIAAERSDTLETPA